ncbi:hypothetical protein CEXT_571181 [Caerostris extrusa]|uniref:Uncharacterized protein n=1 Tax=Caerostris extrusa TaxID=172846 RepID=A0AAV4NHC9_CAEEX|nr:hypothetical protein CEXT_571181 [Caerostris extrusa]
MGVEVCRSVLMKTGEGLARLYLWCQNICPLRAKKKQFWPSFLLGAGLKLQFSDYGRSSSKHLKFPGRRLVAAVLEAICTSRRW